MKRYIFIGLALIALMSAFSISKIDAQTSTPGPGYVCRSYDFTTGDHGWTILGLGQSSGTVGVYTPGTGFTDTAFAYAFTNGYGTAITSTISDFTDITSITADLAFTIGDHSGQDGTNSFVMGPNSSTFSPLFTITFGSQPSSSSAPISSSFSTSGSNTPLIIIENAYQTGSITTPGSSVITGATICGNGPTPTATITPTASPTPTLAPPPPGGPINLNDQCTTLGANSAYFKNVDSATPHQIGAWQVAPTSIGNPPPFQTGLLLNNAFASAKLLLTLDRTAEYRIGTQYHVTSGSGPGTWEVKLGDMNAYIKIPVTNTESEQIFDVPAANYAPDQLGPLGLDKYTLEIAQDSADYNATLIIDSICIYDGQVDPNLIKLREDEGFKFGNGLPGATAPSGAGVDFVACQSPTYKPVGDLVVDLPNLVSWLWDSLWNFFQCQLVQFLQGLWQTLSDTIQVGIYAVQYIIANVGNVVTWGLSVIHQGSDWLWSLISNGFQLLLNALMILLNSLGLTDIANSILSFLTHLSSILNAMGSMIGVVTNIIGYWIGAIIKLIITAIVAVPLLIVSIINSFNASSAMPIYAAACTSTSNILYGPCLGFYILDNTVFAGPVYFFFLGLIGFISINVILSTLAKVQKAFKS